MMQLTRFGKCPSMHLSVTTRSHTHTHDPHENKTLALKTVWFPTEDMIMLSFPAEYIHSVDFSPVKRVILRQHSIIHICTHKKHKSQHSDFADHDFTHMTPVSSD